MSRSHDYTFHVTAVHSIDENDVEHIARVSFRHSDNLRGETDISMNIRLHDGNSGPYICFRVGAQKTGEGGNEGRKLKIVGAIFADNIRTRKLNDDPDRRPHLVPALQIRPLEIQKDMTDSLYDYLENENVEFSQLHAIRTELISSIEIAMPDCLLKFTTPEVVAAIKELRAAICPYRKLTFIVQKHPHENPPMSVDAFWRDWVPKFIGSIQDSQRRGDNRRPEVWLFRTPGQTITYSSKAAWDSFQVWDSRKVKSNRRFFKLPTRPTDNAIQGSRSKDIPKSVAKTEKNSTESKTDEATKQEPEPEPEQKSASLGGDEMET